MFDYSKIDLALRMLRNAVREQIKGAHFEDQQDRFDAYVEADTLISMMHDQIQLTIANE